MRAARAAGFDWRAAIDAFAADIPAQDAPARRLFAALVADVEAFPAANAYHNRLHTLDTMWAMKLLCATAVRNGIALPLPPHLLILVMLGHDLRHPGGTGGAQGDLERLSADVVAAFARASGLPDALTAKIVDLILATRVRVQLGARAAGAIELSPGLVGEADVLASLLPDIGRDLAACLTLEMAAAGEPVAAPFESPPVRLAFLRGYVRGLSAPALALGLDRVIDDQIAGLSSDG